MHSSSQRPFDFLSMEKKKKEKKKTCGVSLHASPCLINFTLLVYISLRWSKLNLYLNLNFKWNNLLSGLGGLCLD